MQSILKCFQTKAKGRRNLVYESTLKLSVPKNENTNNNKKNISNACGYWDKINKCDFF